MLSCKVLHILIRFHDITLKIDEITMGTFHWEEIDRMKEKGGED